MANLGSKIVLIFLLVISTSGFLRNKEEIKSANEAFNSYLLNATQNYTSWLKENNLDPTPPISDALTLTSLSSALILLNCELTQQQISGHSSNQNQTFTPEASFNSHYIALGREQEQPYHFTGIFKCTGKMNSPVEENYYFQGEGTYQLNATMVGEAVAHLNLGITEDYKFNFSLAHTDVAFYTDFTSATYSGKWNDSRITVPIENAITRDLTNLYDRFLVYNGDNPLHPAKPLLLSFLRNLIEDLNITTIIKQEELPVPYKPTPTPPTTTPKPTTSTTTAATTESQTSENTEPNTTEGKGMAKVIKFLSLLLALLTILNVLYTF